MNSHDNLPIYSRRRYNGARYYATEALRICQMSEPDVNQVATACIYAGINVELFVKARICEESIVLLANQPRNQIALLKASITKDERLESTTINADASDLLPIAVQLLRPDLDITNKSIQLQVPLDLLKARNIAAHAHYALFSKEEIADKLSQWIEFIQNSDKIYEIKSLLDQSVHDYYFELSKANKEKVDYIIQSINKDDKNRWKKNQDPAAYAPILFIGYLDRVLANNKNGMLSLYKCPACSMIGLVTHTDHGFHTEWAGEENNSPSYLFIDRNETLHCPFCNLDLDTDYWQIWQNAQSSKIQPFLGPTPILDINDDWRNEAKQIISEQLKHKE